MKKFLSLTSSLLLATGATSVLVNNSLIDTNQYQIKENNNIFEQTKKFETIILTKKYSERIELKKNLFDAIEFKNNKIQLNINKLNEKIWDKDIYQLLISSDYITSLNKLLQLKLINFNDGKIDFSSKNYLLNETRGIWTETHWYWFGWWKLCLGSDICNKLASSDPPRFLITCMLEAAGLIKGVVVIAAPFILANWLMLKSFDKGNGVWMGILWDAPGVGYGSN